MESAIAGGIGLNRLMVMISGDLASSMIINGKQCCLQRPVSVR